MGCLLKGLGVIAVLLFVFMLIGRVGSGSSTPSSAQTSKDIIPAACTAADFSLSKLKANTEYDEATLTGIVMSHCAAASGVQLKWTAFNSDGTVAFSNDFWPASTTNIPPHTNYAFEMMNSAPRGKWTYRVEPISVQIW
jgi:hypothetical protein